MKKLLSIIMAIVILSGLLVFPVSAQDDYEPEKYSQAEYAAGFSFKYIYVIIKNEYSFQEFTPEMLSSQLVSRIEAPYTFNPDNPNYDKDGWELFLRVYLKTPEYDNVLKLYKEMKECEYVRDAEVSFIYSSFPFFPESAKKIGYYSGQYSPLVSPENEAYVAADKHMLRNPYYQTYYDGLLAHSVAVYKQFADYMGDVDYISYFAENYMDKAENYLTLIFSEPIDLPENEQAIRDYNIFVLEKYFDEEDILYVGDTVFAAVVVIGKENRNIIKEIEELEFVGDAFFKIRSGGQLCVTGQYNLGNVHGKKDVMNVDTEKITAADARMILRYSAGLEKIDKEQKRFFYCADMNFDGEINSADARLALRTAAGLEETYEILFGYSSMWYDPMGSSTQWW